MTTNDKKALLDALNAADTTICQTKAAFILLKIEGIESALKYAQQVARRNKVKQAK